jgi:hypothetical protein
MWLGRGHRFERRAPLPRMNTLVLHSIPSPTVSAISTLAVAATGDGLLAPERAAGIRLRDARHSPAPWATPVRGGGARDDTSSGGWPAVHRGMGTAAGRGPRITHGHANRVEQRLFDVLVTSIRV